MVLTYFFTSTLVGVSISILVVNSVPQTGAPSSRPNSSTPAPSEAMVVTPSNGTSQLHTLPDVAHSITLNAKQNWSAES